MDRVCCACPHGHAVKVYKIGGGLYVDEYVRTNTWKVSSSEMKMKMTVYLWVISPTVRALVWNSLPSCFLSYTLGRLRYLRLTSKRYKNLNCVQNALEGDRRVIGVQWEGWKMIRLPKQRSIHFVTISSVGTSTLVGRGK